ncbi:zinc finger protein RFP [Anolis carolinensis]|uniref:zinc finger protein RFP n=1 Tax=Anolis carolinensis TaxID=28377 RepID=UPI002F2B2AF5
MATDVPIQALCTEITCPICLDYLSVPMTTACGHNYCQACLLKYWTESRGPFPCPQCRQIILQDTFRVNRHLARMVEHIKDLREKQKAKRKKGECEKHEEPFKLFCKDDEAPICVVCDRSVEHRHHNVVPVHEVSEGYKEKLKEYVNSLKNYREEFSSLKETKERRMQSFLHQLQTEKQKITSAFERKQKLLEERKCFWLGKLQDLEKAMKEEEKGGLDKLCAEISELSQLIREMEEKCLQPPNELLQDIKNTLCSYEKDSGNQYVDLSPKWEEKLRMYSQKNSDLRKAVESRKESLEHALDKVNLDQALDIDTLKKTMNKVSVTLDPSTAHPEMLVSKDLKAVRYIPKSQELASNLQGFNWEQCVLGCERFLSGRHWWEVEMNMEEKKAPEGHLLENPAWVIGVAIDFVKRKGPVDFNPSDGIWAVGESVGDLSSPGQVTAFTSPKPTPLILRQKPKKIWVALDCEEGWVDFFDADTNEFIYTFYLGTLTGETIRPFFCTNVALSI